MIRQKLQYSIVSRVLIAFILFLIFRCSNNIVDWDESPLIECESVWQYLKAYSIYQDSSIYNGRLPSGPFQYSSADKMLAAVKDTFKGANYTGYISAFNGSYLGALSKTNNTEDKIDVVWLDTLSSNTLRLKIESFQYAYAYEQFENCINSIDDPDKFKYMIVDLRNNGGGDLGVHKAILGNFLLKGTEFILARERLYDGSKFYTTEWQPWFTSENMNPALKNKEFVILVNRYTASASEIFASAMRRCRGATIVGVENTYGKAMGQVRIFRNKRSPFQITCLQLREKNNGEYHRVGLKPDIYIENDHYYSEDNELLEALQVLEPNVTSLRKLKKTVKKTVPDEYATDLVYRTIYEESQE